jgi:hypothetical protein
MFQNITHLLVDNPPQLNYGVAVCDVDRDGQDEIFVAGFGFRNQVLKWDGKSFRDVAIDLMMDPHRQAIGVAAGDLEGDGQEEIYVLTSDVFAGEKNFGDRLYDCRDGQWLDLFSLPEGMLNDNMTAGRSVAWIDRQGNGRYACMVANYGGPMRLYEAGPAGRLRDVASDAGVALTTGGRALLPAPLFGTATDIVALNENGPNFVFKNDGAGKFSEVAAEVGIADEAQHGRGIALLDDPETGRPALVYGNWEGPHRFYQQTEPGRFSDIAPDAMNRPSRVRTVLAADFDNDGYQEIYFNNITEPNRMFKYNGQVWELQSPGEALEPTDLGTGGAVGDFDGDGQLELLLSHGEMAPQELTLYKTGANNNKWLRVRPLTQWGAPARGAQVTITYSDDESASGGYLADGMRLQHRVIDGGSGYLCQMEPVAHFGLGAYSGEVTITVTWPDATTHTTTAKRLNRQLIVPHPKLKS